MKREKYISYTCRITILLALLFVIALIFSSVNKTEVTTVNTDVSDVLSKNEVMEINIEIDDSDWQWLIENSMKEEDRKANITINGETFYNVGIRPKGNSSLAMIAMDDSTNRFSLKLEFDKYVDGQTYHGIRKLALNNMMSDATYMKEYLSYDIFNHLGIATPEYSYSNIKLNNENWGLYLAVECIDERFIEKNYGKLEGNLYKPDTLGIIGSNNDFLSMDQESLSEPIENNTENSDYENEGIGNIVGIGSDPKGADFKYIDDKISSYSNIKDSAIFKKTTDEDVKKIIEMIKHLNNGTDIEKYLNVDEVLKYFAANTFLVNLDSYSGGMYHNYYLYENNGVCEILPWDLNLSFGGFAMGDTKSIINFPIDSPTTRNLEDAPLIGKLLEVDEYKEKYHKYLKELVDYYSRSGNFQMSVNSIDKLIGDYVKTDKTAFYDYDQYKNSLPELINFVDDRSESIELQLNGEQPSMTYGNLDTDVNLDSMGSIMQINLNGMNVGKMLGSNKNVSQQEMLDFMNLFKKSKDELNDEDKEKLSELGLDEDMMDGIKEKMAIMMFGSEDNVHVLMHLKEYIISLIAILAFGLIFSYKYKRKKYI